MLQNIDTLFAFARGLGLVDQMEEIILVTGCHRTKSSASIAFLENRTDSQASFGVKTTPGHEGPDDVSIEWEFPFGSAQGAVCNWGPEGRVSHFEGDVNSHNSEIVLALSHSHQDLPEDQCIFIRGFRVARALGIFPRQLRGAAGYDRDDESDDELDTIPASMKVKHSC
jgi:hypothetical protein